MEKQGFAVGYAELYDRLTPLDDGERGLRHWLAAFAGTLFAGLSEAQREDVCLRCEDSLRSKLYDGRQWVADYRRIRIKAVKPAEQTGCPDRAVPVRQYDSPTVQPPAPYRTFFARCVQNWYEYENNVFG
ncbi:hypothetical protein ACVLD2_001650 [Paenibacillus sp. PvR052]